ncbi:uncharacterized protein LOC130743963 [Lotus japonicus]|uniref:uncharacterized protein LOC130743963 n=1 Tax=Lotus japonicus TaxID=34305 RepID=UPI00258DCA23|nr:uncharacterized protein LOC130743963 [Lotus japonicus]
MVNRSGANGRDNHVNHENVPPDILQQIMADLTDLRQHNQQLQTQLAEINQDRGLHEGDRRMAEMVVDFQPFTEDIANSTVPDNLKTLVLDSYYGDSDPKDHLVYFNTKMSAMTWFTTLPPRSIAGFMDLSAKFLSQFSTSRAQKVTPAALFNFQQRHNESLQSFMGRFNQLSVHLEDKMSEICIAAFELGLQSGSLNSSLSRKPVETMAELRSKVQGFIREEQSDRIKRNRKSAAVTGQQQQSDSKKAAVNDQRSGGAITKGERSYNNSSRFDNRSNFRNRAQPYGNRGYGQSMTWTRNQQDRSTPLAVNLTEALHMCLEANTIRFPKQPKRPPGNVDRSKWCEYHRIAGHNTDDCFTLKKEIEALIKAGYMRQLDGRKESEGAETSTKRDDTGKEIEESEPKKQARGETKGRIHSIFGGFRGGGMTNSSRKRYVHSINAVYANDWGNWGINQPDITFTLGLTETDLLPYDGALVGFSGEKVFVRGYVELNTVFGEGKNEKAFAIKFLVVQCTSPYNVLIGRPSLNKLGAIISTRHLTVKYPLDKGGVGTLKSD